MTSLSNGMTIGLERTNNDFFISLKLTGKLTHEDYQAIIPIVESALAKVVSPNIDAFIDASAFEGWEVRAAWDDLVFGLKHNNEFRKVAIYGDKDWLESVSKLSNWFVTGEVKHFTDPAKALAWLAE
ncbi:MULTISPECIES: SpoIIAA family protein [Thalassotalea]|uniref:STAS/SEC14 domain-containing protein n=1 Tax=Thalassotalea TaxID=1518149 RepID=UPI000943408B|nr:MULTISPECIES: STAS/SEC14 domain-containing protein [Thalassotalea]OKY27929.1 STAS/SEC14 domain-containing protein [Thalassotalea sp. PP2-459]